MSRFLVAHLAILGSYALGYALATVIAYHVHRDMCAAYLLITSAAVFHFGLIIARHRSKKNGTKKKNGHNEKHSPLKKTTRTTKQTTGQNTKTASIKTHPTESVIPISLRRISGLPTNSVNLLDQKHKKTGE